MYFDLMIKTTFYVYSFNSAAINCRTKLSFFSINSKKTNETGFNKVYYKKQIKGSVRNLRVPYVPWDATYLEYTPF